MLSQNAETFLVVVEKGSFSKAADQLFMSTVAVMNQINAFEGRLGIKLFERSKRGLIPTAAGLSLYNDIRQMIVCRDEALRRARATSADQKFTIRVGVSMLNRAEPLIEIFDTLIASLNMYDIELVSFKDDQNTTAHMISIMESDFDIFVGPCSSKYWKNYMTILPLGLTNDCIAVPKRHPLSARKFLTFDDLQGQTLVTPKNGDCIVCDDVRSLVSSRCPSVRLFDTGNYYSYETFNFCSKHNYLLHTLDIWNTVHPSMVTLPVRDDEWNFSQEYGIVYLKNAPMHVISFINTIRNALDSLPVK